MKNIRGMGWQYALLAGLLTTALGLSPTAADGEPAPAVAVMRGSTTQVANGELQASNATLEAGVVVMRPDRGSFLSETSRLAAEAQLREESAEDAFARAAHRRLAGALEAAVLAASVLHTPPATGWVLGAPWVRHDPGRPRFHKPLPPVRSPD